MQRLMVVNRPRQIDVEQPPVLLFHSSDHEHRVDVEQPPVLLFHSSDHEHRVDVGWSAVGNDCDHRVVGAPSGVGEIVDTNPDYVGLLANLETTDARVGAKCMSTVDCAPLHCIPGRPL